MYVLPLTTICWASVAHSARQNAAWPLVKGAAAKLRAKVSSGYRGSPECGPAAFCKNPQKLAKSLPLFRELDGVYSVYAPQHYQRQQEIASAIPNS